jgi:hypothetical protein
MTISSNLPREESMKLHSRITHLIRISIMLLVLLFAATLCSAEGYRAAGQTPDSPGVDANHSTASETTGAQYQGKQLITIISPEAHANLETAPVTLRVRLGIEADAGRFRAFLNKREITSKFAHMSDKNCRLTECVLAATVVPDDGLSKGKNRLSIVIKRPNSRLELASRSFLITGPKADAGAAQRVKVGQLVQLDGTRSVSNRGYDLSHQWTLVRRPQGSSASLQHASTCPY